jgi:1-deoxyxylulose-5-phosphate synthase
LAQTDPMAAGGESDVELRNLGRTGVKVTSICLGAMMFGGKTQPDDAYAIIDKAIDGGINFIDTANVYNRGHSEEAVGEALKRRGRRDSIVLATKVHGVMDAEDPNEQGNSRRHIIAQCEASLRRLQTDRIDVYYIHLPDPETPIEETMEAFDRLQADGKILYVGISNFSAWQLALGQAVVAGSRLAPIAALQPRYNLLFRQPERDLLPLAAALGIGVMPYNPLGAGMLTGKYRRGSGPPPESRFGWGDYGRMYQGRYWSEEMFGVVDALAAVAEAESVTPAQAALAWLLGHDSVTAPIVGASRPDQLRETVKCLEVKLSGESIDRLNEASKTFL